MLPRSLATLAALAYLVVASPHLAHADPEPEMTVTVLADGHVEVGGQRLDDEALRRRAEALVRAVGAARAGARVAADRDAPYARVVQIMDLLRSAGITRFSLVTQPEP